MKKIFTLLLTYLLINVVNAQSAAPSGAQPYGKVDMADLEMKACDFEKDANAMVLFDVEKMGLGYSERHTRIKIFNEKGKERANIKIRYFGGTNLEHIEGLEAETINLIDGKAQITKLDSKQIYTRVIDKVSSEKVFSMPEVRPGSIIEYTYKINSLLDYELLFYPVWFFQDIIPVRYSELAINDDGPLKFNVQIRTREPISNHSKIEAHDKYNLMVMTDIPSLQDEPKMTSYADNLESVIFRATGVGYANISNTWPKVGTMLDENEDFGQQLKRKLNGEETLIAKAKGLKTSDDKLRYLYLEVRNSMKWNDVNEWSTTDGTRKAWDNKTGNSTEINIILYHLLKLAGVKACPLLVSTRNNGKVNPVYTSLGQFNKTVVFVPRNADSSSFYVLDASNKYNAYNEIPEDLLNSFGLCVDQGNRKFNMVELVNEEPVRKVVLVNATVTPDGKLNGTTEISDYGYNRVKSVELYKTVGEEKYIENLRNKDNSIKISGLKLENTDVDTLPLTENFNFNLNLSTDQGYIYLNPNLFTSLTANPFLNPNRVTDIDFGYRDNYAMSGVYTIPAGYKVDVLPKSMSIVTPDNSITFKRVVVEQDGNIMVRYAVDHKKTLYFKEDYPDFFGFYKKMYDMLNEQIVLKKS